MAYRQLTAGRNNYSALLRYLSFAALTLNTSKKMKRILPLLALGFSFNSLAQTVCGTAPENGSVILIAPAGRVFTSVTFASYGTPGGTCGNFVLGACNATNTRSIVEGLLLGRNTATIGANNGVFGDPCNGTVKSLYIQAVYSFPLPLSLTSFTSTRSGGITLLQWQTTNEVNTKSFAVERSEDGVQFSVIGNVTAANSSGNHLYSFTHNSGSQQPGFYRLKMIDLDENFTYSNILKTTAVFNGRLEVSPNPVTTSASISGLQARGYLELTTLQGVSLERLTVTGNAQVLNMTSYPAGIYVLKYVAGNKTLHQKIVKQ